MTHGLPAEQNDKVNYHEAMQILSGKITHLKRFKSADPLQFSYEKPWWLSSHIPFLSPQVCSNVQGTQRVKTICSKWLHGFCYWGGCIWIENGNNWHNSSVVSVALLAKEILLRGIIQLSWNVTHSMVSSAQLLQQIKM